jgi:hypothetical protein
MDKKTIRIIILMTIIALLLAIILYFLFFFKWPGSTIPQAIIPQTPAKQTQVPIVNNQTIKPATTTPAVVKKVLPPPTSDAKAQRNLEALARSFAELFGSYSNQTNYINVVNSKLYMTDSFKAWADKYIATNEQAAYSGSYQGMVTKAITDKILNFDGTKGQSTVVVTTQRDPQPESSSSPLYYQDITITFIKQANNWLIDNAVWKK